jgi:hypothetical protein
MAKRPVLVEAAFRSSLERKVADQLDDAGVSYGHESQWLRYTVPQREAKYLPDFTINDTNILIEAKGRFGGGNPRFKQPTTDGAKERQKLILLKEQHPGLEIRIVFERASTKIYKGSPTSYGKWATDHGFKWSDKGIVPPEWIKDLKKKPTTK